MARVFVTIPNEGWIHKHVCFVTDNLLRDKRHEVTVIRPTHKPYENNLHHCLNEFMAGPYEYWLNIDADNPPLRNPLDLIAHDKDIIGLPTPVFHWTGKEGERPVYWNAYKLVNDDVGYTEWEPKSGLMKVDAIGTGCWIAQRRIFEKPEMRKAPFQRICNADGTVEYGNDLAFCKRLIKAGFEVWCHFDFPCRHFCEVDLHETVQAFKGLGIV